MWNLATRLTFLPEFHFYRISDMNKVTKSDILRLSALIIRPPMQVGDQVRMLVLLIEAELIAGYLRKGTLRRIVVYSSLPKDVN